MPESTQMVGWRARLMFERVIGLGATAALGVLTALLLMRDDGLAWPLSLIDDLSSLLHRLGYEASGWADRINQILVGPGVQIAIPILLAFVLSRLGRRQAVTVAWWWLGYNVVHIARSMAAAPWQQTTPITGDFNPWNHWFLTWKILGNSESIARAVFWSGALLMIGAVLVVLRRVVSRARR
jgi:hypothetical protein